MKRDRASHSKTMAHHSNVYQKNSLHIGPNKKITIASKLSIILIIFVTAFFSDQTESFLQYLKSLSFPYFLPWASLIMGMSSLSSLVLFLLSDSIRMTIETTETEIEFSSFSWIIMILCAGFSISLLVFCNPAVTSAQWSVLTFADAIHLTADPSTVNIFNYMIFYQVVGGWSVCSFVGFAISFIASRHTNQFNIRSTLTPIFGTRYEKSWGYLMDMGGIIITMLAISATLGFGIKILFSTSQSGINLTRSFDILGGHVHATSIFMLVVIMSLSIYSVVNDVYKGVAQITHLFFCAFILIIVFFLVLSFVFIDLEPIIVNHPPAPPNVLFDSVLFPMRLHPCAFQSNIQTLTGPATAARWMAVSPFIGLFFARISRGRSVREYIMGTVIIPAAAFIIFLFFISGPLINHDLFQKSVIAWSEIKLPWWPTEFLGTILSQDVLTLSRTVLALFIISLLIFSGASAILTINILSNNGRTDLGKKHIIIWGITITILTIKLIVIDSLQSIDSCMVLGGIFVSTIIALMMIALLKGVFQHIF